MRVSQTIRRRGELLAPDIVFERGDEIVVKVDLVGSGTCSMHAPLQPIPDIIIYDETHKRKAIIKSGTYRGDTRITCGKGCVVFYQERDRRNYIDWTAADWEFPEIEEESSNIIEI